MTHLVTFLVSIATSLPSYAVLSPPRPKGPLCVASKPLPMEDITPVGIKRFLMDNQEKVKTVEDFVCCLPQEYRENFVIAHTSLSAQEANPHNSRMVLFNPDPREVVNGRVKTKALQTVLTFNGGDPALNKALNVEMIHNNQTTREIEMFDISFEEAKGQLGPRNPDECLACHGSFGEKIVGGPKTIFEPFNRWSRFVDGIEGCTMMEKAAIKAMEEAAIRVLQTNPRYKCLKHEVKTGGRGRVVSGTQFDKLVNLDTRLAALEARRIATLVKATPDYDQYKFAIIGDRFCQQLPITKWLPPRVIAQHNNQDFLLKEVIETRSEDLKNLVKSRLKASHQETLGMDKDFEQQIKTVMQKKDPHFHMNLKAGSCSGENESMFGVPEHPNLDRFKADTTLRQFREARINARHRFFIEGRGISMKHWDMSPFSTPYQRTMPDFESHLLQAEPAGSPLKALAAEFAEQNLVSEIDGSKDQDLPASFFEDKLIDQKKLDATCARLSGLSLAAFADQSGTGQRGKGGPAGRVKSAQSAN